MHKITEARSAALDTSYLVKAWFEIGFLTVGLLMAATYIAPL